MIESDYCLTLENSLIEIFNSIDEVMLLSDPYQDCLSFLISSLSPTEAILVVVVDCLQDKA